MRVRDSWWVAALVMAALSLAAATSFGAKANHCFRYTVEKDGTAVTVTFRDSGDTDAACTAAHHRLKLFAGTTFANMAVQDDTTFVHSAVDRTLNVTLGSGASIIASDFETVPDPPGLRKGAGSQPTRPPTP